MEDGTELVDMMEFSCSESCCDSSLSQYTSRPLSATLLDMKMLSIDRGIIELKLVEM
jgi:hypothetical protein